MQNAVGWPVSTFKPPVSQPVMRRRKFRSNAMAVMRAPSCASAQRTRKAPVDTWSHTPALVVSIQTQQTQQSTAQQPHDMQQHMRQLLLVARFHTEGPSMTQGDIALTAQLQHPLLGARFSTTGPSAAQESMILSNTAAALQHREVSTLQTPAEGGII